MLKTPWGTGGFRPPTTPKPSEAGAGDDVAAGAELGPGPGNAGKSSLDIVNSDDSMAGCLTIPTVEWQWIIMVSKFFFG